MLRIFLAAALLAVVGHACGAPVPGPLRKAVLDAVRPEASKRAGQPIRIRVRLLNVDRGWALLIGDAQAPNGGEPDWTLSEDCDNGLDKTLFALAHRIDGRWQVAHLDLCEGDPPYEDPGSYDGLDLPCGIYKDVPSISEDKPLDLCRAHQGLAPRRRR